MAVQLKHDFRSNRINRIRTHLIPWDDRLTGSRFRQCLNFFPGCGIDQTRGGEPVLAVQILAPAVDDGTISQAIHAGADLVYTGIAPYCHHHQRGVEKDQIPGLCRVAREAGAACGRRGDLFLALNRLPLLPIENEFWSILDIAREHAAGVILNDLGLIAKVRHQAPNLTIMASIGLSPLNLPEVTMIRESGADQVLLPDNLDLAEVREIRRKSRVGLELFACGVREFFYTGRCLISSYAHQEILKESGGARRADGSAKRGGSCREVCHRIYILEGPEGMGEISLERSPYLLTQGLDQILPLVDTLKIMGGNLAVDIIRKRIQTYRELVDDHSARHAAHHPAASG